MNYHHRRSISLIWRVVYRSLSTAVATPSPTPSTFPTKTVTKSNFESALEALKHHVKSADFVAIDLEMTGITSAPWREMFEFDRYDVRYLKIKDSAEKFAVVQFGVCPFRWDSQKHSFIAHPHNFYIFPRQELLDGSSSEFLCQTASIDFLAKYQFDFNACINEGISYLSREQEEEMLRHLDGSLNMWHSPKEFKEVPLVKMADLFFNERMKNRFQEWVDGLLGNKNYSLESYGSANTPCQQLETTFYRLRPALSLKGFTTHQLRLIRQVIRKHFEDLAYVSVDGKNSAVHHFVVYTDSKADRDVLMKEVRDEVHRGARVRINAVVGFRRVIDLLSSEQKSVVGHNCFLDVAHIYSKFFGHLPLDAREFVLLANKYFPRIFDTKVLLNSSYVLKYQMKKASTSLSRAFAALCPQIALGYRSDLAIQSSVRVEVQVDDMRALTWDAGSKHEAGYDAFMTGCLFAQACSHLGVDFKLNSFSEILANNEVLQKHVNLLYLSWTYGDIIDLSTGNRITESITSTPGARRHLKIVFENIVIMWGFSPNLKSKEIKDCISKVLGPSSVAFVYHLDETAVFIQFSRGEFVSEFLSLKKSLEKNNDPISVLHPFSRLLEGGNTFAADYEIYREICASSTSKVLFADQAEAVGIQWSAKLLQCSASGETPNQEGVSGNIEGNAIPNSMEKMGMSSGEAAPDSNFSCNEIVDSFFVHELEQVRTY